MKESKTPCEYAEAEGKTFIARIFGPVIGVYYPNRKTGDLYVGIKGCPTIHCCQCETDIPDGDFLKHVTSHNRAKRKYLGFIIDPSLIASPDD